MKFALFFTVLMSAAACAKKDLEILPTESLLISAQATRGGSGYVYCSVYFYRQDEPNTVYTLEQDSIVACDGIQASSTGSGFGVSLYHPSNDAIQVTIVRPKAGATVIEYADIQ